MSLRARANRRDVGERDIIDALKAIGATVVQLDKPVDLLVGYCGRNYLLEVKAPPGPDGGQSTTGQKLKPAQVEFVLKWGGQVEVVTSSAEAVEIVKMGESHGEILFVCQCGSHMRRSDPSSKGWSSDGIVCPRCLRGTKNTGREGKR